MDIRSILVNVDLETAGSASLTYAIDLAQTVGARLIGLAADQPNLALLGTDVTGTGATDFYVMERSEIERRLTAAEQQFTAAIPAGLKAEWRADIADPVRSLIATARCADLIVTGPTMSPVYSARRRVDLGELVIGAGRPVIDIAKDTTRFAAGRVMIAWKDTREARRAVADGLPFLKLANEVNVVTISEGDPISEREGLADVAAWLAAHGVDADTQLIDNKEGFDDVLETTAAMWHADMLITGGYGHSRMREWLFGGVTRNLLQADSLTRLFSN